MLERARRALRAERPGVPQRAAWCVIWSASRDTTRGVGRRRARPAATRPARSAAGAPGVEYHAEHAVLPDGTERAAARDQRRRPGVPAGPVPRCRATPTRTTTTWRAGPRPRTRTSGSNGWTPSPGHAVLSLRSRGRHRLRVLPLDALDCRRRRGRPAFDGRHRRPRRATRTSTPTAVTVVRPVLRPARRSGRTSTSRTGERTERHRQEAPGPRPATATSASAGPSRRRTGPWCRPRWCGTGTPRSTAPRPPCSTATAPTSRPIDPEWDPALPSLLDRGVVFAHAHVRGGGEGGRRWWLDGRLATEAEHLHRPPRGRRRAGRARRRQPDRHPRAQRRRPAPGRGVQPAPGPLAGRGRRGAVRRRGHHDVRRRPSR